MNSLAHVIELVTRNLEASDGDACRVFHGRGRSVAGWEQVCIDWFDPVLLVTLFQAPDEQALQQLLDALCSLARRTAVSCVAVQSRFESDTPMAVVYGELPRKPLAREGGLEFGLQLGGRQNTGFFLDMAEARRWLATRAAGKHVLNLFAYTCAFSVVARAAGAQRVVNLDMSSASLRMGQQNHQRNGIADSVSYLSHNLFRSWGKLRRLGPFDMVIVDPPSRQPGSFVAERDYERVLAKLPGLCAEGADVLLCLNSPHLETGFLLEKVSATAPVLQFCERLPNPSQFVDENPELSLKVMHFVYSGSGAGQVL